MASKAVGIIGAGAWGTAMAQALARGGNSVEIWAMEPEVADSINNEHENKKFLPGFTLSENLKASTDLNQVASNKEVVIFASPSLFLASTVAKVKDCTGIKEGTTCIGVLTKGFVPSSDGPKFILETMEDVLPASYKGNLVYIAGPSHAEEVAMGKLTGLIAASENPMSSIRIRELLKVPGLLVYSSLDVIGVQVCAAAKNVIAVVFGCVDAMAETSDLFGDNAESLLLAAGLNEIQTLGFALGATHAETFTSISGIGDLDVTCRSKYGRNRRSGQDIIKNNILENFKNLDDLIANISKIGYLPEGAVACKYIQEISEKKGIKLPLTNALFKILNREKKPEDFLSEVLG